MVAVGTSIAARPPLRSVRERQLIRLLPWMHGREALRRKRMIRMSLGQETAFGFVVTSPAHSMLLTPSPQRSQPEPRHRSAKARQGSKVARHAVVTKVTRKNGTASITIHCRAQNRYNYLV